MTRFLFLLLCACTGGKEDPADDSAPTWAEDVAPIYAASCMGCHQEGALGPMGLSSYEEAAQWGAASIAAIESRTMPPWGAEGPSGHGGEALADDVPAPGSCDNEYADSLWLTDDEIAVVRDWFDAGMPEGGADEVEVPTPDGLEQVDLTVATPSFVPEATSGSGGEYDEYRCFVIDPGLEEDRWLTAYDVVPGNDAIVHHVIAMPVAPTDSNLARIAAQDGADGRDGWTCFSQAGQGIDVEGEYVAWAPGQGAVHLPEGSGLEINAGDLLVVQMHYNMVSTDNSPDSTAINMALEASVERPAQLVLVDLWERETLSAGGSAEVISWQIGERSLSGAVGMDAVTIEGIMPHMHELGRQLTVEVGPPDDMQCVTGVRSWDFGWQRVYFYDEPVSVGEQNTLRVSCTFDLSGVDHDVSWGWGTQDEMCLVGLYVTDATP